MVNASFLLKKGTEIASIRAVHQLEMDIAANGYITKTDTAKHLDVQDIS